MNKQDLEIKVELLSDILQELIVTLLGLGVMTVKDKDELMKRVGDVLK